MKFTKILILLMALLMLSSVYAACPSSMVSYWSFESDATDNLGTHDGTITGDVSLTTGKVGNGYSFGGSDDYIEVPSLTQAFGTDMTIALWIKPSGTQQSWTKLLKRKSTVSGYDFYLGYGPSQELLWNPNGVTAYSPLTYNNNEWYHVVGTTTSSSSKLYVNGIEVKSAGGSVSMAASVNSLIIGSYHHGTTTVHEFSGIMDEVAIYDTALTAGEVSDLYTTSNGGSVYCGNEAEPPPAQSDHEGTDLAAEPDIENVPMLIIENTSLNTQIVWSNNVDVSGQDLNTNIKIGSGFVSLNSASLDSTFNSQADVSLSVADCSDTSITYSTGFATTKNEIISSGQPCTSSSTPSCTNVQCSNNNLTFTVSGFTGYAAGGNSQLEIYDENEGGTYPTGSDITFYANYTNLTSDVFISGADCNVSFDDAPSTWFSMTENAADYSYTKVSGFAAPAIHIWNVSCAESSFTPQAIDDTVEVTGGAPPGVPEFNFIGLIMIVAVAGIGMYLISKR